MAARFLSDSTLTDFKIGLGDGRAVIGKCFEVQLSTLQDRSPTITLTVAHYSIGGDAAPATMKKAPVASSPGWQSENLALWMEACSPAELEQFRREEAAVKKFLAELGQQMGLNVEVVKRQQVARRIVPMKTEEEGR